MSNHIPSMKITVLAIAAVLCLAGGEAHAQCDCTILPTLGAAADFPALGINNTDVELVGAVLADSTFVGPATEGNVGTGAGGSVLLQGAAAVIGYVHHHTGTTVTGGTAAAGGVFEVDMTTVSADALAASAAFAALGTTQTFNGINSTTTITGNGCINVIQVNNDIAMNGNKELRVRGSADDYFIFNVHGEIDFSGNSELILDGLNPHQVLFNIVSGDSSDDVDFIGNAASDGTYLNPFGEIDLQGDAGGRGAYMSGGSLLRFQGNTDYYAEAFACGVVPLCPDPESTGVNIQTPATPIQRSTGNTPFYHAYYDTSNYEGHLESYRVAPTAVLEDSLDVDSIDSVTGLLIPLCSSASPAPIPCRTPYWDAGIELRTNGSRTLYTTKANARTDFTAANITAADLDITLADVPSFPNFPLSLVTTAENLRVALINYVHGEDAFDEDADLVFNEMRIAVLGDIFHSNALFIGSPLTLMLHEDGNADFVNDYDQRDRVVYAGANDALLHAFDAGDYWDGRDPSAFNSGTGAERFGYIPGLLLPIAKSVPKTIDANGDRLVPGFVDGNTVAADAWLGDGSGTDITKSVLEWATVLISAYREGGRGYLALDITDPDATSSDPHGEYPKYLWEFTDTKMGESWSRAVITRIKVKGQAASLDHCGPSDGDGDCREQWVAVWGGGHSFDSDPNDGSYFADDTSAAWSPRSKSVFIVALDTGQILAELAHDNTAGSGFEEMKYGFPSAPAVLDLNTDGFADVIYIGDTGGQLWKWDVSAVGEDTDADGLIDNFPSGIFFDSGSVVLGNGDTHYRSIYAPAAAAYNNGVLNIAFGTGERRDVLYGGDVFVDDQNRFYVIEDLTPTNWALPLVPLTEGDLVDVTSLPLFIVDPLKSGYYIIAEEGEKFFTDVIVFAGHIIAASYLAPDPYPTCGTGESFLYVFELGNARGFFDTNATAEAADRRLSVGSGVPSSPRVTVASNPDDDVVFVTTSDGQVLLIEPPTRDGPDSETLYWRKVF